MTKHLDLENVKIYTKDEAIEAIKLIGCTVYMSDDIDFKNYYEYTLSVVQFANPLFHPFVGVDSTGFEQLYKYFILKKDAKFKEEKEKKYRFYKTIKEFPGGIGSVLTYRSKSEPSVHILTSIQSIATQDDDIVFVCLGGLRFTPLTLFKDYEYLNAKGDEWKPFGVEE